MVVEERFRERQRAEKICASVQVTPWRLMSSIFEFTYIRVHFPQVDMLCSGPVRCRKLSPLVLTAFPSFSAHLAQLSSIMLVFG